MSFSALLCFEDSSCILLLDFTSGCFALSRRTWRCFTLFLIALRRAAVQRRALCCWGSRCFPAVSVAVLGFVWFPFPCRVALYIATLCLCRFSFSDVCCMVLYCVAASWLALHSNVRFLTLPGVALLRCFALFRLPLMFRLVCSILLCFTCFGSTLRCMPLLRNASLRFDRYCTASFSYVLSCFPQLVQRTRAICFQAARSSRTTAKKRQESRLEESRGTAGTQWHYQTTIKGSFSWAQPFGTLPTLWRIGRANDTDNLPNTTKPNKLR